MRVDFEEQIVYNPMLGAILLWEFTRRFYTQSITPTAVNLLLMMPVIPIVLHRPSMEKLKGMRFDSGLAKVIHDVPTFTLGLQERVSAHAKTTFKSLNVSCAAGLIQRAPLSKELSFIPKISALPAAIQPAGTALMLAAAARRLGAFFRDDTPLQLEIKLGIVL